jgi:hypothetical protein
MDDNERGSSGNKCDRTFRRVELCGLDSPQFPQFIMQGDILQQYSGEFSGNVIAYD